MTNHHHYTQDDNGDCFEGIFFALIATVIIAALIYGAYCLGHGYGIEIGMNLGTLGALD